LGLGYSFGNSKVDLAYENIKQKTMQQLYQNGSLDAASINNKNSIVTLTLSLDL